MLAILEFMAHSVDLLNVSKDHFGIYPAVLYHTIHVIRSEEVWNSRVPFSIDL